MHIPRAIHDFPTLGEPESKVTPSGTSSGMTNLTSSNSFDWSSLALNIVVFVVLNQLWIAMVVELTDEVLRTRLQRVELVILLAKEEVIVTLVVHHSEDHLLTITPVNPDSHLFTGLPPNPVGQHAGRLHLNFPTNTSLLHQIGYLR